MLILHISDIHFRDPLCHGEEDPELYYRNELVTHATEQVEELGDVDAILVSGDIAFRGIKPEYEAATKWLEALATATGCKKGRIYVVPGNHDVDRSVFNKNVNARNAVRAVATAPSNDDREAELKLQLGLEGGDSNVFASIEAYNQFAAKYDCQMHLGRLSWKHSIRIDSRTVLKLHGLNSTIVSGITGDDDQGKLYMGAMQMNVSRAPGTVNLAMAHHPPEWMSDQGDIEQRLLGAPNIVLFGHRHKQRVHRDTNGPIMFSAGSVNPERHEKEWEPAYNFIQISPSPADGQRSVEIEVHQFRWQSNPNGFVRKIDTPTGSNVFDHSILISGSNNHSENDDLGIPAAKPEEGEDMTEGSEEPRDTPVFATPSVRDLIYRFWELSPVAQLDVLEKLDMDTGLDAEAPKTMTYRTALIKIAQQNRLAELEAVISEQEASQ